MEFVYKPAGVPEKKWRRWHIDVGELSNDDAEQLEDLTGWTLLEWQSKFFRMSIKAVRAYLFVMLSKTEEGLTFDSLKFKVNEFEFDETDDEKAAAEKAAADQAAAGADDGTTSGEPEAADPKAS